jgi:hypothetical protein
MNPERRPNPARSPESLEARLRALPQPPVPAGLEARLLATIPAAIPIPQRHWGVWVGALGASAAACLVVVLAWPGRVGKNPVLSYPASQSARLPTPPTPRPPDDSASIPALREARRVLDETETPMFTWPLPETLPITLSTSIPPDLLD